MAAATALALGLGALAFRRLGRDLAVVV
jgi:hypothetical protein